MTVWTKRAAIFVMAMATFGTTSAAEAQVDVVVITPPGYQVMTFVPMVSGDAAGLAAVGTF